MTAQDDRAREVARRLIAKRGRDISIMKSSSTPYDPAKPWKGSVAPAASASPGTTVTGKGVFVDPIELREFGFTEEDGEGTDIKRAEKACIVAATGLTPETDISRYTILLDGEQYWRIERVRTLKPGDQIIMHALELCQS